MPLSRRTFRCVAFACVALHCDLGVDVIDSILPTTRRRAAWKDVRNEMAHCLKTWPGGTEEVPGQGQRHPCSPVAPVALSTGVLPCVAMRCVAFACVAFHCTLGVDVIDSILPTTRRRGARRHQRLPRVWKASLAVLTRGPGGRVHRWFALCCDALRCVVFACVA